MTASITYVPRNLPCIFLGRQKAEEMTNSSGKRKQRILLGVRSSDGMQLDKDKNAVAIGYSRFFKNRYANLLVQDQHGCAQRVSVNLRSLKKRTPALFSLGDLKEAARNSTDRDITQFVRQKLALEEYQTIPTKMLSDEQLHVKKSQGEKLFNEALALLDKELDEDQKVKKHDSTLTPEELVECVAKAEESENLLKKAAKQGYAPAYFELAQQFVRKKNAGEEVDGKDITNYLKAAASLNHIPSILLLAKGYAKKCDYQPDQENLYATAVKYARQGAYLGDLSAQVFCGSLLLASDMPSKQKEGAEWLKIAQQNGSRKAFLILEYYKKLKNTGIEYAEILNSFCVKALEYQDNDKDCIVLIKHEMAALKNRKCREILTKLQYEVINHDYELAQVHLDLEVKYLEAGNQLDADNERKKANAYLLKAVDNGHPIAKLEYTFQLLLQQIENNELKGQTNILAKILLKFIKLLPEADNVQSQVSELFNKVIEQAKEHEKEKTTYNDITIFIAGVNSRIASLSEEEDKSEIRALRKLAKYLNTIDS